MSEKLPFFTIVLSQDGIGDLFIVSGQRLARSPEEAIGMHMKNTPANRAIRKTHVELISDKVIEELHANLVERQKAAPK